MTALVTHLVAFAVGLIAGAVSLHRIRAGRKRAPSGFVGSDDWRFPGHPLRIIDVDPADADHLDAVLRGDV